MAKPKIKYEAATISYQEASNLFRSKHMLLAALRDGDVIAYGDYYLDPTLEITSGRQRISAWEWQNYKNINDTLFGGTDENGSDDPVEYRQIVISKESIDDLKQNPKTKGRGASKKYNEDLIWQEVAKHFYEIGREKAEYIPSSLRDWVRNAQKDYAAAWKDSDAPSETYLKDKLRPLWSTMEDEFKKLLGQEAS